MTTPGPLSLRHFIYRSQVLSLYRQFVRTSRWLGPGPQKGEHRRDGGSRQAYYDCFRIPPNLHGSLGQCCAGSDSALVAQFAAVLFHARPAHAAELVAEVRRNFEAQSAIADLQAIKFHLSEGRKRLEQLQDMLGLQRTVRPSA